MEWDGVISSDWLTPDTSGSELCFFPGYVYALDGRYPSAGTHAQQDSFRDLRPGLASIRIL
jgi:hypothetical protein